MESSALVRPVTSSRRHRHMPTQRSSGAPERSTQRYASAVRGVVCSRVSFDTSLAAVTDGWTAVRKAVGNGRRHAGGSLGTRRAIADYPARGRRILPGLASGLVVLTLGRYDLSLCRLPAPAHRTPRAPAKRMRRMPVVSAWRDAQLIAPGCAVAVRRHDHRVDTGSPAAPSRSGCPCRPLHRRPPRGTGPGLQESDRYRTSRTPARS